MKPQKNKIMQWALTGLANHLPDQNMVALTLSVDKNIDADGNGEIQIFPAGRFYAKDGRRSEGWELTQDFAEKLIAAAENQKDDYMVDFEHQTIYAASNGQPNPAAGWFKSLEYRPDAGLFAKVKWNAAAAEMIEKDEYRYISPFFESDEAGNILSLFNVGLTNTPAIDGMAKVVALSELIPSDRSRSGFREQLKTLLDSSDGLSTDQLVGAVREMVNQVEWLSQEHPKTPEITSSEPDTPTDDTAVTEPVSTEEPIPDPEKYISIEAFNEVREELAKLQKAQSTDALNTIVEEALKAGKLTPAQKSWAMSLGNKNMDSLKEYLSGTQPIVPIGKSQTGGAPSQTNALTAEQKRLEQMTGLKFNDDSKGA